MKASVDGHIVAQSDDIVANHGYQYFPQAAVRMDWLEKTEKTESDHACPHGVQFYDVVVHGQRHKRAAWWYKSRGRKWRKSADNSAFGKTSRSHERGLRSVKPLLSCDWRRAARRPGPPGHRSPCCACPSGRRSAQRACPRARYSARRFAAPAPPTPAASAIRPRRHTSRTAPYRPAWRQVSRTIRPRNCRPTARFRYRHALLPAPCACHPW